VYRSVSGSVMTNGVNGTAAHIHLAAKGGEIRGQLRP
jgi:hypothetical protein